MGGQEGGIVSVGKSRARMTALAPTVWDGTRASCHSLLIHVGDSGVHMASSMQVTGHLVVLRWYSLEALRCSCTSSTQSGGDAASSSHTALSFVWHTATV